MAYSAETTGKPASEVIMLDGEPIELRFFVGAGLFETVSNLRKLNPLPPEDTPQLPEAA